MSASSTVRRCAVVGVGARTPLGLSAPAAAAAVYAGISATARHAFMLDQAAAPMMVCADALLDPGAVMEDRLTTMAASAALESAQVLIDAGVDPGELPLVLALPETRPGLVASAGHHVEDAVRLALTSRGLSLGQGVWCNDGHAGGVLALQEGVRRIVTGQADHCLVGGVDSWLVPETLEWLDAQERLHSDTCIWGFCPGEAAGFCLLASPTSPLLSQRPALLDILMLATAREPKAANAGGVCIGEGLTAAFHGALAGLAGGQRVAHTLCDMNGEVWRADEYGFAVLRTTEHFTDEADYNAPATSWGDVGAASVPLLLGLVATVARRPYARGPRTLLASSSLGNLRGAVLVEARVA